MLDKDIILKIIERKLLVPTINSTTEYIGKAATYNIALKDVLLELEQYFDGNLDPRYIELLRKE